MHKPGAIILVPFPFSDQSGSKVRPVVILAAPKASSDTVVAFITTKKHGHYSVAVKPSEENGLHSASFIRADKITAIDKKICIGEIGTLEEKYLSETKRQLKILFGL